jgi:hypothetical protein
MGEGEADLTLLFPFHYFQEFLLSELGGGTVKLMKAIKNTIDPLGICNPGKVSLLLHLRHSARVYMLDL